ncbi:MAG: cold shock domain-containing protein [Chloroflexota bacterium]
MNFKDMWATDEDGNQFVFTVEMQRQMSVQGLKVAPESLKELQLAPPQPAKRDHHTSEKSSKEGQSETRSVQNDLPSAEAEIDFNVPMTIQIDPETGKYIGRMKWYNAKKGYGFIVRGAGEELFFHKSSISGDPADFSEGQWILYDIEETRKGPEAAEVEAYDGDVSMLS